MRVLQAAALTLAAILLASITSAQGLGTAAAREKEKRKATPAKPVKVYTDQEVHSVPEGPPAAEPAGDGTAAKTGTGDAKSGDAKLTDEEKAAAAEAEAKAKALADWKSRMEDARQTVAQQTELIGRLNAYLGDQSAIAFGPARAAKAAQLDEAKQKLTDAQAKIADLEEEGRRNGYR